MRANGWIPRVLYFFIGSMIGIKLKLHALTVQDFGGLLKGQKISFQAGHTLPCP